MKPLEIGAELVSHSRLSLSIRRRILGSRLFVLFIVVVLQFVATPAEAVCISSIPADRENRFSFAMAFVDSLGYAKSAVEQLSKTHDGDGVQKQIQEMLDIRKAAIDYECARDVLSPYKTSTNSKIGDSAETAVLIYSTLLMLDEELLRLQVKVMDSPPGTINMGEMVDHFSKVGAAKNNTWKQLVSVAAMVSHTLVKPPGDPNARATTLNLTTTQRNLLLSYLRQMLGPDVTQGLMAGQPAFLGAGAGLYQFLSNPNWKTLAE